MGSGGLSRPAQFPILVLDMSDRIFRLLFPSSCGVLLAWGIWTAIFTLYPIMVGLPILH